MTEREFIKQVLEVAQQKGFHIEDSRNGKQIDFGHKKLHEKHLGQLFKKGILDKDNNISEVIDEIAPGRPCTHKPIKMIIEEITYRREITRT